MEEFRLLDMGPMTAAQNMALDQTLLELKGEGGMQNSIRFLQFSPPAVLVGYHQSVAQEVHVDYCLENSIHINRRISGGGAIFLDLMQLGWEIICDKNFLDVHLVTEKVFARLCEPVVKALNRLGVNAGFRPRNDIEINGRKISGTGGTELYDALFFHGTILVDINTDNMLYCLNVAVEKLKAREIDSIKNRVTCLKQELGQAPDMREIKNAVAREFENCFDIRLAAAGLTIEERRVFEKNIHYFESDEWIDNIKPKTGKNDTVRGSYKSEAGMVAFTLAIDRIGKRVKDICITGDFLSFPATPLYNLEAQIRGSALDRAGVKAIAEKYFKDGLIYIPGMTAEDFLRPLDMVFDKIDEGNFDA
jgi:lipoate---protein ligase